MRHVQEHLPEVMDIAPKYSDLVIARAKAAMESGRNSQEYKDAAKALEEFICSRTAATSGRKT